jgi:hypothetical protein
MTDIVRILESYSTAKGFTYHYGRNNVLNLLETGYNWDGATDSIYFLHEFRRGNRKDKDTTSYSGTFYLVVHSSINQNYFQEVGLKSQGKYQNNIEPLIDIYEAFESYFFCSLVDVKSSNFIDVSDFLDANLDGIKVDYTIEVPNRYTL